MGSGTACYSGGIDFIFSITIKSFKRRIINHVFTIIIVLCALISNLCGLCMSSSAMLNESSSSTSSLKPEFSISSPLLLSSFELGSILNLTKISTMSNVTFSTLSTSSLPMSINKQKNHLAADKEPEFDQKDVEKLHEIVRNGLGLTRLPVIDEINISQKEYSHKFKIYLERLKKRKEIEKKYFNTDGDDVKLQYILKTFKPNKTSNIRARRKRNSVNANDVVYVRFPLPVEDTAPDIEEATLRLMIRKHHHHYHEQQRHHNNETKNSSKSVVLNLKVYQLIEPYNRIWLDTFRLPINNFSVSKWIELNVRKAVESWLKGSKANLGLEILCESCANHGLHIVHDISSFPDPDENHSPALNIVTRVVQREKRSKQYKHYMQHQIRKPRQTDCQKNNHKCCRHPMDVTFKDIKGYEFIIQPKTFDAGYCRGKCPPSYNPAHHHALLQSLIWKQDKSKAPRPCCAPIKLVDLEVLHVDERDPTKLKVATWTDMRVLECACS